MSWEDVKKDIYKKWKAEWFRTHPPDIAETTWDYLFTGGKEIRARLFCSVWTHLSPETKPCAELAFAIECIHVTSLILDDSPWMDNSPTRRGKPTLHTLYSEKKLVLLCHDLLHMAYRIWTQHCPPSLSATEWSNRMREKLQRLLLGQWYDMDRKGSLIELASSKTGVLFEWVTETVAYHLGLECEPWRIWGNELGILFQWADDWNDREEDRLLNKRNAFHEQYENTQHAYRSLWDLLKHFIGPSWFKTPFGQYIHDYFTSFFPMNATAFPVSLSTCLYPWWRPPLFLTFPDSWSSLSFPKETLFQIQNGMELLQKIYTASLYVKEPLFLSISLWDYPEEEWETLSNIQIQERAPLLDPTHTLYRASHSKMDSKGK